MLTIKPVIKSLSTAGAVHLAFHLLPALLFEGRPHSVAIATERTCHEKAPGFLGSLLTNFNLVTFAVPSCLILFESTLTSFVLS